jgi:ketosteroid isomerase-like protein
MKRHTIEFLWAWFDALRRRDTEAMTAALHPDVVLARGRQEAEARWAPAAAPA